MAPEVNGEGADALKRWERENGMTKDEWEWESLAEPTKPRKTLPHNLKHWNRKRQKAERAAARARYEARKREYEEFIHEYGTPDSPESVFAGERFFRAYRGLAYKIAQRVARSLEVNPFLGERSAYLYSAAELGLWDAIRRYDSRPRANPGQGSPQVVSFAHFAKKRIAGEIVEAIRAECILERAGGHGPAEIERQMIARVRHARGEVAACAAVHLPDGVCRIPDRAVRPRGSGPDDLDVPLTRAWCPRASSERISPPAPRCSEEQGTPPKGRSGKHGAPPCSERQSFCSHSPACKSAEFAS